MRTQAEKAHDFRALHASDKILILPNAWDTPSARLFEDMGFPAVATSSAGLMVSLGYPDGETIPRRELVRAVGRIASRLAVPLSADVVAGFGRTPREVVATVRAIIRAGAVGINLEDTDPRSHTLFPTKAQSSKIQAICRLGESMRIPIVINARTDAFRGPGPAGSRLQETILRCTAYRDAGADCVYPMGVVEAADISAVVKAVQAPVNVMIRRGLPPIQELVRLGVKRVSFGPDASYAAMGLLRRASREVLEEGTYESLLQGALTHDELNSLAVPRPSP